MKLKGLITLIMLSLVLPGFSQAVNFPYELRSGRDAVLIASGSALIHGAVIGHNRKAKMKVNDLALLNPADVNPFDRFATRYWEPPLNDLRESFEPASVVITCLSVGSYGLYSKGKTHEWESLKTLSLMYLEGLYLSAGTMLLAKTLVERPRPYAYNTNLPLTTRDRGANNESFFSGNATILFYHSVFLSQVFSDLFPASKLKPWIWAATLSLSTFSGILSVRSGWHYPTDVMTGALVGGLAGYLIPALHKAKAREHLVMMPWASPEAGGVTIGWTF